MKTVTKPESAGLPSLYQVSCTADQSGGLEVSVCQASRHRISFQVFTPGVVLRVTEVLPEFRIFQNGELVYSGRAVITNVVDTGTHLICQASLENAWLDFRGNGDHSGQLSKFIASSLRNHVSRDFKVAVADLQMVLYDLQQWTDQVSLRVLGEPAGDRGLLESDLIREMYAEAASALANCFERFELSAANVAPDQAPCYAAYVKRQLHPIVLCAPFMYRTYRKPLGYAGDYEMVSMMMRNPFEGASPFAKVLNAFFLSTPPVVAHQNRIVELKRMLVAEFLRANSQHRSARVLNIGCGPAKELQEVIAECSLVDLAEFTLIDFNQETLDHTGKVLKGAIHEHARKSKVQLLRRSVAQMLKDAARSGSGSWLGSFDVVYCAGLFDYLPDSVCRQLLTLSYNLLADGGLLLATNVDQYNPSRSWMELAVDWHLIYRDASLMATLLPSECPPDSRRIYSESSGVNVFVEARKSRDA